MGPTSDPYKIPFPNQVHIPLSCKGNSTSERQSNHLSWSLGSGRAQEEYLGEHTTELWRICNPGLSLETFSYSVVISRSRWTIFGFCQVVTFSLLGTDCDGLVCMLCNVLACTCAVFHLNFAYILLCSL